MFIFNFLGLAWEIILITFFWMVFLIVLDKIALLSERDDAVITLKWTLFSVDSQMIEEVVPFVK